MKLVIVGGGAGGPTAAARARRLDENAEIVMFERGEHVSYGHCGLPYYIGGVIENREALLISTPERFRERYRVEARVKSEVKAIITDEKQVEVLDLSTGRTYRESYDKLILATGASPIKPPLPGIDMDEIFTLRNLTDADRIVRFIEERKPQSAVVVGGGFIGLEMAENLRRRGLDVTVVEMLDQVMPVLDKEMADTLHRTLLINGVNLALSDPVMAFEGRNGKVLVKLKSGREIPCDMVMLSIGVRPNVELARSAGLEMGGRGGIKVDDYLRTSNPDIYAVGDAVETKHVVTGQPVLMPLAGPANRQVRIAADNVFGRNVKYRGTLGTSLVKVFETTAGATGVNEKTLKSLGIPYEKSYIHPSSHAGYYPGAEGMEMKLLFSPEDGRVLGAQIVGGEGVDKRIDVLATAIIAGMNVEDLTYLEMGYVPQYGSAKDPVNLAGYVASNILKGDMPVAHWEELDELQNSGGLFLDVRSEDEYAAEAVPGSVNIYLHDLRDRLDELPKDRPIYTYCAIGLRSYIATRILRQRGFDVKNMSGGFKTYRCVCLYDGAKTKPSSLSPELISPNDRKEQQHL
ncbi:FAD-dependent oxidoreductase [Candidatus Poribacteria bacterium]|nr:FAD-dependent oxidoreductase [Candidatus Poribacteria bacterium]